MKKLSKKLVDQMSAFLTELNDAAERAREYYDNRSEAWQDSDTGASYLAWVEQLDDAVTALEELPDAPGE